VALRLIFTGNRCKKGKPFDMLMITSLNKTLLMRKR